MKIKSVRLMLIMFPILLFSLFNVAVAQDTFISVGPKATEILDMKRDPGNPDIIYIITQLYKHSSIHYDYDNALYKSTDGGETWDFMSTSLTGYKNISLDVDPNDSKILYAATNEYIYKSTNGGYIWSYYFMYSQYNLYGIKVDKNISSIIYGFGNLTLESSSNPHGICFFKSTNAGMTWEPKTLKFHTSAFTVGKE